MGVKQIPKKLLPHQVEYAAYVTTRYGPDYAAPITIANVRVEEEQRVVTDINGESLVMNTRVFVDRVNSSPLPEAFTELSKLTFNGRDMVLERVIAQYAIGAEVHHWELMCR